MILQPEKNEQGGDLEFLFHWLNNSWDSIEHAWGCEMAGLWHSQSILFSLLRIDVSWSQINLAMAIGINCVDGKKRMDLACHRVVRLPPVDAVVVQGKLHRGVGQDTWPLLLVPSDLHLALGDHQRLSWSRWTYSWTHLSLSKITFYLSLWSQAEPCFPLAPKYKAPSISPASFL